MSVNWNWKHKMGVITFKDEYTKERYDVNFYRANCLGALIYEYKEEATKKDMYIFKGFFNDITHLKRCLGLVKGYDNIYKEIITKIKLNVFYEENFVIAKYFAKANFKVEIYYEEIK